MPALRGNNPSLTGQLKDAVEYAAELLQSGTTAG